MNGAELADVLEVGPNTTPSAAKSQLDRLKQAYGLLYSNSAQRSKNRFGNLFRNAPHNPIFGDRDPAQWKLSWPDIWRDMQIEMLESGIEMESPATLKTKLKMEISLLKR